MLTVRFERPGTSPLVVVAIDRRNVEHLTAGRPLVVDGERVGLEAEVAVVFGERLEDVLDEMAHAGLPVAPGMRASARRIDATAA